LCFVRRKKMYCSGLLGPPGGTGFGVRGAAGEAYPRAGAGRVGLGHPGSVVGAGGPCFFFFFFQSSRVKNFFHKNKGGGGGWGAAGGGGIHSAGGGGGLESYFLSRRGGQWGGPRCGNGGRRWMTGIKEEDCGGECGICQGWRRRGGGEGGRQKNGGGGECKKKVMGRLMRNWARSEAEGKGVSPRPGMERPRWEELVG